MDINQASQMITWLDEEHRRDKALLTELRQKVESQAVEINDQAKRIQELENRLASTQGKFNRFNTVEQTIQQLKEELVDMVQEQEAELKRYQRDQMKSRQMDQEAISRAINELKRSLDDIPPLQERISLLKSEDQRLAEQIVNVQTRVTSHERQTAQLPDRITYIEGQRTHDVKAVSQVQEEIVELMRRAEGLAGKIELVDDIARKSEQRINALSSFRDDLSKRQSQLHEDLRLKDAQRDRLVQDWRADMARFYEEQEKQRKLLERFARQQEESQQYLVGIEEYKEMINKEQQQIAELQRLSEERQRREFEEWITANEQRWTKFRLERESQWHQQEAKHEELVNRVEQIENWRDEDVERTQKIARELLNMQEEYRTKLNELWKLQERAAVFQMDRARRWYDEISNQLEENSNRS